MYIQKVAYQKKTLYTIYLIDIDPKITVSSGIRQWRPKDIAGENAFGPVKNSCFFLVAQ